MRTTTKSFKSAEVEQLEKNIRANKPIAWLVVGTDDGHTFITNDQARATRWANQFQSLVTPLYARPATVLQECMA